MDFISWNALLFVSKWILIGLVYFALVIVLIAVRREMSLRIGSGQSPILAVPGRLRVVNPGRDNRIHAGAMLSLQPETCLGAERDNDLVLRDPFVSGHHARLRWDGSQWWLEDLNSSNGTYLNQRRCLPEKPQPVSPGSILQLGDMSFEMLA